MSRFASAYSRPWRIATLAHFLASFTAFWLTAVAAQAGADSTAAAPRWLELLHALLTGVLLQPLAFWILESAVLRWWTWPGLAATSALLALNSVMAVACCLVAARLLRHRH